MFLCRFAASYSIGNLGSIEESDRDEMPGLVPTSWPQLVGQLAVLPRLHQLLLHDRGSPGAHGWLADLITYSALSSIRPAGLLCINPSTDLLASKRPMRDASIGRYPLSERASTLVHWACKQAP